MEWGQFLHRAWAIQIWRMTLLLCCGCGLVMEEDGKWERDEATVLVWSLSGNSCSWVWIYELTTYFVELITTKHKAMRNLRKYDLVFKLLPEVESSCHCERANPPPHRSSTQPVHLYNTAEHPIHRSLSNHRRRRWLLMLSLWHIISSSPIKCTKDVSGVKEDFANSSFHILARHLPISLTTKGL